MENVKIYKDNSGKEFILKEVFTIREVHDGGHIIYFTKYGEDICTKDYDTKEEALQEIGECCLYDASIFSKIKMDYFFRENEQFKG